LENVLALSAYESGITEFLGERAVNFFYIRDREKIAVGLESEVPESMLHW
jgi:hypothetical protein